MTDSTPGTELALLRGEIMTMLARIEGDVRLVLQVQQQDTQKVNELAVEVRRQDERQDAVERTMVTRDELDQREQRERASIEEQARRRLMVVGLVVTVIAALLSSGIAVIGITIA